MLEVNAAKLTGPSGISGLSRAYEFLPSDPAKVDARGRLFAVFAADKFEDGALKKFHEAYFGDPAAKPFNALKDAAEKVVEEFGTSSVGIEIAAVAVVSGVVNCVATGGGSVMISRRGTLATILASSGVEVAVASGYSKDRDFIIIGTKRFFGQIPLGVIKSALQNGEPEDAVETFTPIVNRDENPGRMGAVIIKFGKKKEREPEVVSASKVKFSMVLSGIMGKIGKILPKREIHIKVPPGWEADLPGKKSTLSVGIILLVILAVSIGFGITQKNIREARGKYEGDLFAAQRELDEAVGLAAVSPERARELFISSEGKLQKIEDLKVRDTRISELRARIQDQRGLILGEYSSSLDSFLDLTLLSSGFKGDALSLSEGNLFVLDRAGKKIISIEVPTKKSKVTAGPDKINEVVGLASYSDRVFFLDSNGINEIGRDVKRVIEKDWEGEVLIHAYTGNLYVLDKGVGKIYRYGGSTESSFGTKQNWLSEATKPDLSNAKAWTIDGAVYVLVPPARVLKFSLGSPQSFPISGVYPGITVIDAIYSGDETRSFYLLDKSGKRVIALDKTGKYKAQYISDQISDAVGLVVSEKEKKIILLTGDKLYSLEIKHLD